MNNGWVDFYLFIENIGCYCGTSRCWQNVFWLDMVNGGTKGDFHSPPYPVREFACILILCTKRKPVFQTNLENRLFLTGNYRGVRRVVEPWSAAHQLQARQAFRSTARCRRLRHSGQALQGPDSTAAGLRQR